MAIELSYLLITPYTLMKSRTGGVIARLFSRTDLELVATQMLTPTIEFAQAYADSVRKSVTKRDKKTAKLLSDYILQNFPPATSGKKQRVLLLLFRGEDACRKLYRIAGHIHSGAIHPEAVTGETIRDTYGDLVLDASGRTKYFEPAVLTPPNLDSALENLPLFANFAESESNIVKNVLKIKEKSEQTLVIIKPDNWRHPSTKPGNIIDMFSRTGLRIVGCKIYQMSVAEALEFYGPVQGVLKQKLAPIIGKQAVNILEEQLNFTLSEGTEIKLAKNVGLDYADDQFHQIIEFMSGLRPEQCPKDKMDEPGLVKSMVLVYEGKDAVDRIRSVLGPTDPTKAPGGTVRREFGQNIMVNTAHASDSVGSAKREMKVVKMKKNQLSNLIREFLEKVK